jgi:hypothetical protein
MNGKRPRKPGFFARRKGPTGRELYAELRTGAAMRIKIVDGAPAVAMLRGGSVEILPLASKDFFPSRRRLSSRSKGETRTSRLARRTLGTNSDDRDGPGVLGRVKGPDLERGAVDPRRRARRGE